MISYPAVIKYNKTDRVYEIDFPDFNSCFSYGETKEEAIEMGREALSGVLETMLEHNIPLPNQTVVKNSILIEPYPSVSFAVWIRKKRTDKGLSQKQVAKTLGVSYQAFQRYENPKKANPTLKNIIALQNVFNEKILII